MTARKLVLAAVVLLFELSTSWRQQSEKKPSAPPPGYHEVPAPRQGVAKGKATTKTLRWASMPDGRVIEFRASTSEEIDALEKRIAEGAVELPPGARVIGWEPVEGADRLPPAYDRRVATIPTAKGKLDALANAAGILQAQINSLQSQIDHAANQNGLVTARVAALEKLDDGLAKVIDENTGVLANDVSRLTMRTNQLDDLKRELDHFKAAACPLLRRAAIGPRRSWDDVAGTMRDQDVQRELDSACGRH